MPKPKKIKKSKKATRVRKSVGIIEIKPGVTHPPETYFTAPRALALPELWCKIEAPAVVTFLEKMRADVATAPAGGRKRPAMLARVRDLKDGGAVKDLAVSAPLAELFAMIPLDGYIGRTYVIRRHRRHERKNAAGYTVTEETGHAET